MNIKINKEYVNKASALRIGKNEKIFEFVELCGRNWRFK
jgi:hypothetical protein